MTNLISSKTCIRCAPPLQICWLWKCAGERVRVIKTMLRATICPSTLARVDSHLGSSVRLDPLLLASQALLPIAICQSGPFELCFLSSSRNFCAGWHRYNGACGHAHESDGTVFGALPQFQGSGMSKPFHDSIFARVHLFVCAFARESFQLIPVVGVAARLRWTISRGKMEPQP